MKKYARLLAVTLAAVFVFAACDSSGGGDPGTPDETIYSSPSGRTVLTLTKSAAAQNAPARRAPPAGERGTYTLKVDGVEQSRGDYLSTGGALEFTSEGGKEFKADVKNGSDIEFQNGGTIPLDDNSELIVQPLKTGAEITLEDFGLGSIDTNKVSGETLVLNGPVFLLKADDSPTTAYDGDQQLFIEGSESLEFTGGIVSGTFNGSVKAPTADSLQVLEDYNRPNQGDFPDELFSHYDNVQFSDPSVKCHLMGEFEVVPNPVEWQGFACRKQIWRLGAGKTFAYGDTEIRFIYVTGPVTLRGNGKTTQNITSVTSGDLNISLSKGWNALYKVTIQKGTSTGTPEDLNSFIAGATGTGTFVIEKGFPSGLQWLIEEYTGR